MNDRISNEQVDNLNFNGLIILNRLGRGSTSHVFKTQSIKTKKYYAMKVIDKSKNDYCYKSLIKQINIHKILKHKNISQFVKHIEDNDNHYILTEYCNNGQLTKLIMQFVDEKKLLKIVYEIGLALNYMHNQMNVVHGDLKLSNILMNKSDLKLCDFGYSFNLNQIQEQKIQKGPFGTLLYMAPQVLKNNCTDYKKADIWALGICLLVMMLQGNPYKVQSNISLKKKIINSEYIYPSQKNFPQYSNQFLQLVQKMLQPDFNNRIEIDEILKHKALAQFRLKESMKNQQYNNKQNKIQTSPVNNNQFKQFKVNISKQSQIITQIEQKQDVNKSIFNLTLDTLTDCEVTTLTLQSCKIWSYCLKPQKHKTQNNGFIQILKDHSIKIKIDKLQYVIEANGNSLQILQGYKNCKRYVGQQIKKSEKIVNLFNYGVQLVNILKKKFCLKQQIINGKYFWMTKKEICCLINQKTIIEKDLQNNKFFYRKTEQLEKTLLQPFNNQIFKYVQIFQKVLI